MTNQPVSISVCVWSHQGDIRQCFCVSGWSIGCPHSCRMSICKRQQWREGKRKAMADHRYTEWSWSQAQLVDRLADDLKVCRRGCLRHLRLSESFALLGAVHTQGFVWDVLHAIYKISFIHSQIPFIIRLSDSKINLVIPRSFHFYYPKLPESFKNHFSWFISRSLGSFQNEFIYPKVIESFQFTSV